MRYVAQVMCVVQSPNCTGEHVEYKYLRKGRLVGDLNSAEVFKYPAAAFGALSLQAKSHAKPRAGYIVYYDVKPVEYRKGGWRIV